MNDSGEFFVGMKAGGFVWSPNIADAKPLQYLEQFKTIERHEPLMELVYEYI